MPFPLFLLTLAAFLAPQWAIAEPASATDKVVETFMALDLDESATVSYEEYEIMVKERLDERFKAMDKNGDGQVSPEEYREFWTTQKAEYYRPRR